MIELLLAAERMLAVGMLDHAERLFRQVTEADPRNSIAVVGLARVALERDDEAGAIAEARRALEIDPENAAARRMIDRLEEVIATRAGSTSVALPPEPEPEPEPVARGSTAPEIASEPAPVAPASEAAPPRRSLLDRIRAFFGRH